MNYENVCQVMVSETLKDEVYAKVTKLLYKNNIVEYMVEALFKYTHKYVHRNFTELEKALSVYRYVIE